MFWRVKQMMRLRRAMTLYGSIHSQLVAIPKCGYRKLNFLFHIVEFSLRSRILIYFGAEENASGTVAFQPTVLQGLGYSSTSAQVHSIPIYMTAWAIMLICSMISMRIGTRFLFMLFGCMLNMVGLALGRYRRRSDCFACCLSGLRRCRRRSLDRLRSRCHRYIRSECYCLRDRFNRNICHRRCEFRREWCRDHGYQCHRGRDLDRIVGRERCRCCSHQCC